MAENAASERRGGTLSMLVGLAIWTVFVVRAVRWWLRVSAGQVAFDALTGWEWLHIGFIHMAVVVGVIAIVEIIRERQRTLPSRQVAHSTDQSTEQV